MSNILSAGGFDIGGKVIEKITGSDKATKFASSINPLSKEDTSASKSEKKRLSSIRESGQTEAARIFGASAPKKRSSSSLITGSKFLT
jgi:hypothetical protein